MEKLVAVLSALALPLIAYADTAYGTLNNFDVVNDTTNTCYGFLIELDDVNSTDVTYTYDWNHYGPPRIMEDNSIPGHPRVFIWHESKKNPDGTYASWTNPVSQDHPIGPTSGHDCTNPSVNYGCEHFGVGLYKAPSLVKYNWLIDNPARPGNLIVGPAVTISAPVYIYTPPIPQVAPAQVAAVIEPPEPPEPQPGQWGEPVWVKVLKTVQQSPEEYLELDELVSDDDDADPNDHWDGGEEPETEIEWMLFQKRPPEDPDGDEIEQADDLPEGDEMVIRRYEFYKYLGERDFENGEALCDNPDECPEAVGEYLGAQMAGFNVEAPLGLIDHLQDGEINVPYLPRTVIVGGNKDYSVHRVGALPDGLEIDGTTGVLSGTPTVIGLFNFTIEVTDADSVSVTQSYALRILAPLAIVTDALPNAQETKTYQFTLAADGGVAPYFWEAILLPPNFSLSSDGILSGQPAAGSAGTRSVIVSVSGSTGEPKQKTFSLTIEPLPPLPGDIDGDRDVDLLDYKAVMDNRNKPAAPGDPRDLDGDGKITVLDARKVALLFTRPGGAVQ